MAYQRVILKVSGEVLTRPGLSCLEAGAIGEVAASIAAAARTGCQIGVVVGAGNLVRGRDMGDVPGLHRATADHMGMLATVINALVLRDALGGVGADAVAMSAVPVGGLCEPFSRLAAEAHLNAGRVVVFGGGTGSPFVTTDMCAALRACELDAQAVLKATKVDGVYDDDPATNPAATRYERLTYRQVLADRLGVMDMAAIGMCMEKSVPVLVFKMADEGSLDAAIAGRSVGTLITD